MNLPNTNSASWYIVRSRNVTDLGWVSPGLFVMWWRMFGDGNVRLMMKCDSSTDHDQRVSGIRNIILPSLMTHHTSQQLSQSQQKMNILKPNWISFKPCKCQLKPKRSVWDCESGFMRLTFIALFKFAKKLKTQTKFNEWLTEAHNFEWISIFAGDVIMVRSTWQLLEQSSAVSHQNIPTQGSTDH